MPLPPPRPTRALSHSPQVESKSLVRQNGSEMVHPTIKRFGDGSLAPPSLVPLATVHT